MNDTAVCITPGPALNPETKSRTNLIHTADD